jgi:hypothetical protein
MSPKRVIYSMLKENNQNIKELKEQKEKLCKLDVLEKENSLEFSFLLFDMLNTIDKLKLFQKEDEQIICTDDEAGLA